MELVGIEDRVGNEPQIMEMREEEAGEGRRRGGGKKGAYLRNGRTDQNAFWGGCRCVWKEYGEKDRMRNERLDPEISAHLSQPTPLQLSPPKSGYLRQFPANIH